MVGLMGLLAGEILYEAVRFVVMLLVLTAAVFVGGKLSMKKAAKKAAQNETPADKN